jgi:hypothetical protein
VVACILSGASVYVRRTEVGLDDRASMVLAGVDEKGRRARARLLKSCHALAASRSRMQCRSCVIASGMVNLKSSAAVGTPS